MQRCLVNVVFVPLLAALLGCDTPAAPSSPLPPPPSPFAKLVGDYALTVEIDTTCTTFPQAERVRRYDAAVLGKYAHYAPVRVVGGGFPEGFEMGEFFPEGDSFRFEWNNFDAGGCDYPEPLSESTDLYLCATGPATVSDSTITGDTRGTARIKGGAREVSCFGSHRFTFVRQAK